MKINLNQKINSPSISFGYSKEYHQELQNKLQKNKSYPEISKYIAEMDKLSISLENDIIELEKQNKTRSIKFSDLTTFLIELKMAYIFFAESIFPKWHISDNLITQYIHESFSKKAQSSKWRLDLAQNLSRYSINDYSDFFKRRDMDIEEIVEQKPEDTDDTNDNSDAALNEIRGQAVDDFVNSNISNLLTLYRPEQSSPNGFCDVVGMDDVKLKLKESLIDYVNNPKQAEIDYKEYGISAPRGFLFYGPPGCGKTYITKALSQEAGMVMYSMDVSKLGSKFVNETSNNIQTAFDYIERTASKLDKPIILFMDEVDSLAIKREGSQGGSGENLKTTATLLKLIETARDRGIVVIGATNKFDLLDDAFKARFDGQIYFPLPDENQIKNLLKDILSKREKGKELASNDEKINNIATMLNGYSNRSIVFLIDDASKIAKRNGRKNIDDVDIIKAIKNSELEKTNESLYKKKNKRKQIGFSIPTVSSN